MKEFEYKNESHMADWYRYGSVNGYDWLYFQRYESTDRRKLLICGKWVLIYKDEQLLIKVHTYYYTSVSIDDIVNCAIEYYENCKLQNKPIKHGAHIHCNSTMKKNHKVTLYVTEDSQ